MAILQTTFCCAPLCIAILQATICGALLCLAMIQATIYSTLPIDMLVGVPFRRLVGVVGGLVGVLVGP
jgi:hypothetical protein